MTVRELIVELIDFANLDAQVHLVSVGDLESVEDDAGQFVMLHGKETT